MSAVLVIGKDGQVGRALVSALGARAVAFGQPDVNLMDEGYTERLDALLSGRRIAAVINAAAYMQVDKAEGEGHDAAFRINHLAVAELAGWCRARGAALVHFSSDYVYDGKGGAPRREGEGVGPLNVYGESKLAGDEAIARSGAAHLIFRTSWVFDVQGRNFPNTMLRLFAEKETLTVVDNQFGAPTYAPHLARAVVAALDHALSAPEFPSGVYHLCAGGEVSWHRFAQAIFALATAPENGQKKPLACRQINPVPTAQYPTPARRPLNSRLDCAKAGQVLGVSLPSWEAGLEEYFKAKHAGV